MNPTNEQLFQVKENLNLAHTFTIIGKQRSLELQARYVYMRYVVHVYMYVWVHVFMFVWFFFC